MPYISQKARPDKDPIIDELFERCESKGDINYCITKLVHLWALKQMERVKSLTKKYDILNDAYGIICSAAGEFYTAVMVPYEKLKREANGPISRLDANPLGEPIKDNYKCNVCSFSFSSPEWVDGEMHDYSKCPNCGRQDFRKL